MDKITIKDASFLCNIGTTPQERIKKQEILIDIEMFSDFRKTIKKDNIDYALNYSKVHDSLKNVVEKNKYSLIETMAENIAKQILNKFSIKKILVRVKKPAALSTKNVKYVAVEIAREKNG